jgi:glutamate/tyrosine decarboxylase-like PLP-dependent enzyme
MDVTALDKMITEDKAAGKTPCIVVACAGTPLVGHTDNIQKIQETCKSNDMWLHLEG